MVDRLLFPTDGSEAARAGFDHAVSLAAHTGAELFVLHVADTSEISHTRIDGEVVDAFVREGEEIVEETVATAETRDADVTTEVAQGVPDETIVEYATEYDVDYVVMSTRGREGVQRLVGSVTERVLRRATMPVIAIPPTAAPGDHYPYENVLVAVDGSDASTAAVVAGAELARLHQASLHLVHVVEESLLGGRFPGSSEDVGTEAEAILDEAAETIPSSFSGSVTATVQRASTADEGLVDYAEGNDVDVIASGISGRSGVSQYLIGSTTEKLVRNAPVPVMAVRDES